MLTEQEKNKLFHPWNPVISIQSNFSKDNLYFEIFTLEKPQSTAQPALEVEYTKAVWSNHRKYYSEEKMDHYIVLRKDIIDKKLARGRKSEDLLDHLSNPNVYVINACHNTEEAKPVIVEAVLEYARDIAEALNIKEFCSNKGECSSLEKMLGDLSKSIKL